MRCVIPSARRGAWVLVLALAFLGFSVQSAAATHKSDQNHDGVVDLQDVQLLAEHHFGQDWQTVDWCAWLESGDKLLQKKQMAELIQFIRDYFCSRLAVVGVNNYPTRLVWGPAGRLFVSDAKAGSVFMYERAPALTAVGEYKGLGKPLGVALDGAGQLYVGVDDFDRVEVYDSQGTLIRTIGGGAIRMPNDLAFDAAGNLYVVDSKSNQIWVYDPAGVLLHSIGAGELRFPVALEISDQEIFVADQRNSQVKVFDLQGNLLRALGGFVTQGSLGYKWKGKFVHLQSVSIDSTGRLHALDAIQGLVEVLDATTGTFITSYGEKGTGPGQLNLPLDIDINDADETAVSDAENRRVEILSAP